MFLRFPQYSKQKLNLNLEGKDKTHEILFKLNKKPVVGSSRKITEGFVNNSTPIEVLFLSPPEMPLINLFPTLVSAH